MSRKLPRLYCCSPEPEAEVKRQINVDLALAEIREEAGSTNTDAMLKSLDNYIARFENMCREDKLRLREALLDHGLRSAIDHVKNSPEHKKHVKVLGGGKIPRKHCGQDCAAGAEVEERNEELFKEFSNKGVA